jgi:hypothetical protein
MDNGNLSASDVALLSDRNNGGFGWGDSSFLWIFALLILANGGFGGWGGNGFANAIGYENLATSNEVQRGFDNQNSMSNQRDILAAVTSGTAQTIAATNQTFHDTVNVLSDKYGEITRDIGNLALGQQQMIANQNQCCCNTQQLIQQMNYEAAMRDATTNANIVAQNQKIIDLIQGNKIEDMQNRINQLELQNQLAGVVRYPSSMTYAYNANPFCGCGCNGNI